MLRSWRQFVFSCRSRLSGGNRISLGAYIKGIENIRVGKKCKVHADASIDASRSAGVIFGDQVTLNRFAYIQGGNGGVRLGNHVEINNFSIVNGTGGVYIGDNTQNSAGAIVTHDIPANAIETGVPIRNIKDRR